MIIRRCPHLRGQRLSASGTADDRSHCGMVAGIVERVGDGPRYVCFNQRSILRHPLPKGGCRRDYAGIIFRPSPGEHPVQIEIGDTEALQKRLNLPAERLIKIAPEPFENFLIFCRIEGQRGAKLRNPDCEYLFTAFGGRLRFVRHVVFLQLDDR